MLADYPVTEHQYPLTHMLKLGNVLFNAIDHDRSRHAIKILLIAFPVRMGVIPVETGRLIQWNIHDVMQRLPGNRHHGDHIILRRIR